MSPLAKRLGVTRSNVAAWLSGMVAPQIATALKMCEAFDVDLNFFMERVTEPAAESPAVCQPAPEAATAPVASGKRGRAARPARRKGAKR